MAQDTLTARFPKGTIIIREGDVDAAAYFIVSGSVEVFREIGGQRAGIARLGPGQIFGELSLVLERPRAASVEALEDCVVQRIDADDFARMLASDPKKVMPFIRLLFERMRTAGGQCFRSSGFSINPVSVDGRGAPSPSSQMGALGIERIPVLKGASEAARAALAAHGGALVIKTFPFKIGRKSDSVFDLSVNNLSIEDRAPFHVSRNHFSINRDAERDAYFVQDRGSALGTLVNGRLVGHAAGGSEAPLDRDSNEVIAGGPKSPFRFEIAFQRV